MLPVCCSPSDLKVCTLPLGGSTVHAPQPRHIAGVVLTMTPHTTDVLRKVLTMAFTLHMLGGRCSPWLSHFTCCEGGAHHGFHTCWEGGAHHGVHTTHVVREVLTMAFTLQMLGGQCSPWLSHYTCCEGGAHHGFHTTHVGRAVLTMAFTLHML